MLHCQAAVSIKSNGSPSTLCTKNTSRRQQPSQNKTGSRWSGRRILSLVLYHVCGPPILVRANVRKKFLAFVSHMLTRIASCSVPPEALHHTRVCVIDPVPFAYHPIPQAAPE